MYITANLLIHSLTHLFKALCAVVKNLKGLASICFKAIIEDSVNKLIFEMVNVNGIKRIHKFSYQGCYYLLTYLVTYSPTYSTTYSLTYLRSRSDTAVVDSVVDESSYSYVRSEPKIFAQGTQPLTHSFTYSPTYLLVVAFEHLHLSPEILLLVSNDTFQLRSFNQKEITIGNKINKNSVQGTSLTHSLTHSLTYLLTYLLAHLLTHSLTYLLTHSLTHSPRSLKHRT